MFAYHCIRTKEDALSIFNDGVIKPTRLPNVYLFQSLADAMRYNIEFGYSNIVRVKYYNKQVQSKWRPSYALYGVIKLKTNECAKVMKLRKIDRKYLQMDGL